MQYGPNLEFIRIHYEGKPVKRDDHARLQGRSLDMELFVKSQDRIARSRELLKYKVPRTFPQKTKQ